MNQKPASITSYLLPRLQDIVFIGLLFFVCTQGFRLLNGDGDLGRHITIGNYVLDHWAIPTRDIFSHTMTGEELVPHEWLTGVIFALAERLLGLDGDVLVAGIIIASAFTIVYIQTVRRGVFHLVALLITALAALASFLHWLVRPHIFTFLFTAIWILVLERAMSNRQMKLWVHPVIMLVWANIHGAFIFGFIILGAYVAGWAWEYMQGQADRPTGVRLGLIGLLSGLATFVNPVGWHLWDTSTGYMGNQFLVDRTVEYRSPDFHNPSTIPFLAMLIASILLLGLFKKLRAHEVFLFSGWCALSLYSARNIPIFAVVTAPYLGVLMQALFQNSRILERLNNAITKMEINLHGALYPVIATGTILVLFLSGVNLNTYPMENQFDPGKFPVEAVNWLEDNPQSGNVFNHFIWGGYLLYRLWPEQSVFIDGQTDFYGEALTIEYDIVASLQDGWQDMLEKYEVTWAILPSDRALVLALQNDLGWQVIYQDTTATIVRKP